MKNTYLTFLTFLFVLPLISTAQSNWYIGAEISDNLDYQYHLQDGKFSDDLANTKRSFGLLFGRKFNNSWSLETGIISKKYNSSSLSQVFEKKRLGIPTMDFTTIQIPVRLSTSITIFSDHMFVTPVLGYSISFNRDQTSYGAGGGGVFVVGSDIARSEARTIDSRLARNFSLIETGLGISFRFAKKIDLNIHGKYYHSFTDAVSKKVVNYTLNDESIPQIETYTTGSYLNIGIGLRYHFGN